MTKQYDCEKFTGRDYDVCTGKGRDGRPDPRPEAVQAFRNWAFGLAGANQNVKHGIKKIVKSITSTPIPKSPLPTATQPLPKTPQTAPLRGEPAESDRPPAAQLQDGPGTELWMLFNSLGIKPGAGCSCRSIKRRMNKLGAEGCVAERESLIEAIKKNSKKFGVSDWVKAATAAFTSGVAFKINPLDPISSLFDEAVRVTRSKNLAIETSSPDQS